MSGPQARQRLEQVASSLKRTPGIRAGDVRVRRGFDGVHRLNYGTYLRRRDPVTGKNPIPKALRDDMVLLRQLGIESGRRFFTRLLPVRMLPPNAGKPEWALNRVRGKYSLQVAAFEPTDTFWEYAEAAAAYCRLLRDEGYEAFYHHGSASSIVTVGVFGEDAVVVDAQGFKSYSNQVLALQRHDLLQYNRVNGSVHRIRGSGGKSYPVWSQLVEIPSDTER